ncbi:MAG TPA: acyltransferase family protein [Acidimicrobiales bacterium]
MIVELGVRAEARLDGAAEPLGRVAALDGLRGLAVAVVVGFHLGRLRGGFLGVDLFFVLSGFLITSLLVTEHGSTGSIGLGGFWSRRARRLLPAVLALLVGVAVLLLVFTPAGQRAGLRGGALSTLGYVANWQRMVDDIGYWDMFHQPSPLDHMWSLAIEEQFYVVWPVVALLVLGRRGGSRTRRLGVFAVVGAAASFALLAVNYDRLDTNRAYFATDTRIGPTLLGAALAVLATQRVRRVIPHSRSREVAGPMALAWMTWSVFTVDGLHPWYYRGGLVTFAAAAVVVIYVVTGGPPGALARVLAWPPLCALGKISYGVYLWHWPVIVYLTPGRAKVGGLPLDLARVALTLGLAAASFALLERPIRQGVLKGGPIQLATVGAFALTTAAVLIATIGRGSAADRQEQIWAAQHLQLPDHVAAGTTKVLLVGDSGTARLGPELIRQGEEVGMAVGFSSEGFCSLVYTSNVSRRTSGATWDRGRGSFCSADRQRRWRQTVDRFDPDVVVYYLANAGSPYQERIDGAWVWDCDPAYDAYLRDALSDDVELLGRGGATVLIATSPYTGFPEADSDQRVDCRNQTYRDLVAAGPGSSIVELSQFVQDEQTSTGDDLFSDTVHLNDEGTRLVFTWLLANLTETEPETEP